jgi:hypothetical protein
MIQVMIGMELPFDPNENNSSWLHFF